VPFLSHTTPSKNTNKHTAAAAGLGTGALLLRKPGEDKKTAPKAATAAVVSAPRPAPDALPPPPPPPVAVEAAAAPALQPAPGGGDGGCFFSDDDDDGDSGPLCFFSDDDDEEDDGPACFFSDDDDEEESERVAVVPAVAAAAAPAACFFSDDDDDDEDAPSCYFSDEGDEDAENAAAPACFFSDDDPDDPDDPSDDPAGPPADLVNWSGTHAVHAARLAQPESEAELAALLASAHASGTPLRPVGSALSPNGLAFEAGGQVSLALMDKILAIDRGARTVTVQAGARVQDVADALRPHGLTLPVYASIREQSIGGYTQAGVHGTGATVPPADAFVVGIRLVTPTGEILELDDDGPHGGPGGLFRLARLGLGALGVVSAVTLRCEPSTWLVEHTWVASRADVASHHATWLAGHRHLRYMWIPHTDAVVCVGLSPAEAGSPTPARNAWGGRCGGRSTADPAASLAPADPRAPLDALIPAAAARRGLADPPSSYLASLSPMLLRQWLLNAAPLDKAWVAAVNAAEAAHWRGVAAGPGRAGWTDALLGFDCAGPQWVLEVAFPTGGPPAAPPATPTGADLRFMRDLLGRIEGAGVPAHAPIEQRWSAASPSPLSPAAGVPGSLHSWVGIILYLPEEEGGEGDVNSGRQRLLRREVDDAFAAYAALVERELGPRYGATEHWAKVEPGRYAAVEGGLEAKRAALAARFGPEVVAAFAAARARFDPKNVLGSPLVDALFPHPLAPRDWTGEE
jgi:L-galactono-1,4-lactone dehydrogenase